MKYKFLLLVLIIVFALSSCTSRYKSMQTPDDLYYSPSAATNEVVRTQNDNVNSSNNYYDSYYLQHKVRNNYRWQWIDDYSYWNDARYNYYQYNPYNNYSWYIYQNPYQYSSWCSCNCWHNPYTILVPYNHPNIKIGSTSASNVLAYTNHNYNNTNYYSNPKMGVSQGVNTSSNSGVRITRGSSNGNSYSNPSRTFSGTPSSSAGGRSGGFNSSGSNSSSGRGGRH